MTTTASQTQRRSRKSNRRPRDIPRKYQLTATQKENFLLVTELKPDWNDQEVFQFCQKCNFKRDVISSGLANVFEDSLPNAQNQEQWSVIKKKNRKKEEPVRPIRRDEKLHDKRRAPHRKPLKTQPKEQKPRAPPKQPVPAKLAPAVARPPVAPGNEDQKITYAGLVKRSSAPSAPVKREEPVQHKEEPPLEAPAPQDPESPAAVKISAPLPAEKVSPKFLSASFPSSVVNVTPSFGNPQPVSRPSKTAAVENEVVIAKPPASAPKTAPEPIGRISGRTVWRAKETHQSEVSKAAVPVKTAPVIPVAPVRDPSPVVVAEVVQEPEVLEVPVEAVEMPIQEDNLVTITAKLQPEATQDSLQFRFGKLGLSKAAPVKEVPVQTPAPTASPVKKAPETIAESAPRVVKEQESVREKPSELPAPSRSAPEASAPVHAGAPYPYPGGIPPGAPFMVPHSAYSHHGHFDGENVPRPYYEPYGAPAGARVSGRRSHRGGYRQKKNRRDVDRREPRTHEVSRKAEEQSSKALKEEHKKQTHGPSGPASAGVGAPGFPPMGYPPYAAQYHPPYVQYYQQGQYPGHAYRSGPPQFNYPPGTFPPGTYPAMYNRGDENSGSPSGNGPNMPMFEAVPHWNPNVHMGMHMDGNHMVYMGPAPGMEEEDAEARGNPQSSEFDNPGAYMYERRDYENGSAGSGGPAAPSAYYAAANYGAQPPASQDYEQQTGNGLNFPWSSQ